MELSGKKEHVLRCTKLGMDFFSSCVIATCTIDEMALLEKDESFQMQILQQEKIAEYELLKDHNIASRIAINRGNASPVQWRLAKINPKRWGDGKKDDGPFEGIPGGSIILVGKSNDNSDDKEESSK